MVKEVIVYKTSDGQTYEDKEKAEQREVELSERTTKETQVDATKLLLRSVVGRRLVDAYSCHEIASFIVYNQDLFLALLNQFKYVPSSEEQSGEESIV